MKAILFQKYGTADVLELKEIEKPKPKEHEVLVRIRGASVIAGDYEIRSFKFPVFWFWLPLRLYMGLFKPRFQILGQELSGEVEAVGSEVSHFKKGDQIFAPTDAKFGAYAQYKCLSVKDVFSLKPKNMTYEEAATVPVGGLNALHAINKAQLQKGEKVLVNGGAGTIGSMVIQLAKYYGAEVTTVDSTAKLAALRSIGADHVIDYTKEDFTKSGKTYDVIFDIVGKSSFGRCKKCLRPKGRYVLANPTFFALINSLLPSFSGKKNLISAFANYRSADLVLLKELIEAGKIKSLVDRIYPMEEMVDAHLYVESGAKTGNVAISIT